MFPQAVWQSFSRKLPGAIHVINTLVNFASYFNNQALGHTAQCACDISRFLGAGDFVHSDIGWQSVEFEAAQLITYFKIP